MEFNKLVPELSVSSFEKSLDFYTRILGFKVDYDRHDENFAFLSINGAQIMIEEENGHWVTGALEYPLGRGINFQIEVPAIEPLLNHLRVEGIKLFRQPKECWRRTGDEETGEVEFLVMDPDGYLLRFSEFLGSRPVTRARGTS